MFDSWHLSVFSLTFLNLIMGSVAAQSLPSVVCIPGICLEGSTNISIGAAVAASGFSTNVLLLPGQYTSNTNPQLLHDILSSSSASLTNTPGFGNSSASSSFSLPLNVALEPGLATYTEPFFSGQASFFPVSPLSNSSHPLSAASISMASDTWAIVTFGSAGRTILWDSAYDISQFPASASGGSLSLVDTQSSTCTSPCSGFGSCSASGVCVCPEGFNGTSCESCTSGFFGPTCQPCPDGCTDCDDGISGSGRCLSFSPANLPSSCNCLNGQCDSNGQCTCNAGWTLNTNGTQCAQCSSGFFLTTDGNCQVCELGCTECADQTGDCITCKSGFTQDANDRTQCIAPQSSTSSGTVCPDGSFSNGTSCSPCSPLCQTCTGSTSNDCIICGVGQYAFNGSCVSTNGNGVCEGSTMIANNNKHECDSCPTKCTSCGIPSFSVASTINQIQCTDCLPGFVLSQGQCVESCPSGTFLSPKDNLTCTACDSSCSSCFGSANFCLTCANNQLASNGQCVSSCPSETFSSSGSCINCHPDCASCSGGSFNQCSSCPSSRPVLSNGRCLQTCSKSQFFDTASSTCQSCDSSCSSCSAAGPNSCLACSNTNQILTQGTCTPTQCANSSAIPGLGVCLSDLVAIAQASGTSSASALPTISGLNSPIVNVQSSKASLAWWQILLMSLGCAFIFVAILVLWRRRARKRRAQRTAKFARDKKLDRHDWRSRLVRFGERLFGHKPSHVVEEQDEMTQFSRGRRAEEGHRDIDLDGYEEPYRYSSAPFLDRHDGMKNLNRLSGSSLFSEITGQSRKVNDPRQPIKSTPVVVSRFSMSTSDPSIYSSHHPRQLTPPPVMPKPPSPAQEYAMSVLDSAKGRESPDLLHPTYTGGSHNPFRR